MENPKQTLEKSTHFRGELAKKLIWQLKVMGKGNNLTLFLLNIFEVNFARIA
jgi:hypothetical protein